MNRRGFFGVLAGGAAIALTRTPYPPAPIRLWPVPAAELSFSLEAFSAAYIRPSAIRIAKMIDASVLEYFEAHKRDFKIKRCFDPRRLPV
jgi:hypothetical protein